MYGMNQNVLYVELSVVHVQPEVFGMEHALVQQITTGIQRCAHAL
jgi:hypothetical protein